MNQVSKRATRSVWKAKIESSRSRATMPRLTRMLSSGVAGVGAPTMRGATASWSRW